MGAGRRDGYPDLRRSVGGAQVRHDPSRHQAAKLHPHLARWQPRPHQADRLRHRPRHQRRGRPHPGWHDPRHARVHGPRVGRCRHRARRPLRPLCSRCPALQAVDRQPAVSRPRRARHAVPAPQFSGGRAECGRAEARHPARGRRDLAACAGQGPRRPLRQRGRDVPGPAPRARPALGPHLTPRVDRPGATAERLAGPAEPDAAARQPRGLEPRTHAARPGDVYLSDALGHHPRRGGARRDAAVAGPVLRRRLVARRPCAAGSDRQRAARRGEAGRHAARRPADGRRRRSACGR